MATVIFGNGVADVRGSINGTTFSRNGNGAYARNKTTPVNPQTPAQVAQRNRVTALATSWRNLSDAQRQAWKDATPAFPYRNRLGQSSTYTGQQLYTKLNLGRLGASQAPLVAPPLPVEFDFSPFDSVAIALTLGVLSTFEIQFPANLPAGFYMKVFASVGVSPGISATSFPKKLVASINTTPKTDVLDILTGYQNTFGDPASGSKVLIEVRAVAISSGQEILVGVGYGYAL